MAFQPNGPTANGGPGGGGPPPPMFFNPAQYSSSVAAPPGPPPPPSQPSKQQPQQPQSMPNPQQPTTPQDNPQPGYLDQQQQGSLKQQHVSPPQQPQQYYDPYGQPQQQQHFGQNYSDQQLPQQPFHDQQQQYQQHYNQEGWNNNYVDQGGYPGYDQQQMYNNGGNASETYNGASGYIHDQQQPSGYSPQENQREQSQPPSASQNHQYDMYGNYYQPDYAYVDQQPQQAPTSDQGHLEGEEVAAVSPQRMEEEQLVQQAHINRVEDEATLPAANAAGPPDLVAPVKVGASQLEQDSLMTNNPWANLEDGGGEDDLHGSSSPPPSLPPMHHQPPGLAHPRAVGPSGADHQGAASGIDGSLINGSYGSGPDVTAVSGSDQQMAPAPPPPPSGTGSQSYPPSVIQNELPPEVANSRSVEREIAPPPSVAMTAPSHHPPPPTAAPGAPASAYFQPIANPSPAFSGPPQPVPHPIHHHPQLTDAAPASLSRNQETPEHQGHQRQPPDILSGEPVMNGGQSQAPAVAQSMAAAPPPMMIPVQNNSDRNLFMQTGELNATSAVREPVDGGNEADDPSPTNQDDLDIPLDRLVLGESEAANSQQLAPPQQQAASNNAPALAAAPQPPPPPPTAQQLPAAAPAVVQQPPILLPPPPPPGGSRVVAGSASNIEPDRNFPGDGGPSQDEDDSGQAVHPASTPAAQLSPPTPAVMMMGVPAAAPLQPPPLPSNAVAPPIPMVQTNVIAGGSVSMESQQQVLRERSEAVGSDRRDESVMGPPPPSGPSPPPSGRRDVTGSADTETVAAATASKSSSSRQPHGGGGGKRRGGKRGESEYSDVEEEDGGGGAVRDGGGERDGGGGGGSGRRRRDGDRRSRHHEDDTGGGGSSSPAETSSRRGGAPSGKRRHYREGGKKGGGGGRRHGGRRSPPPPVSEDSRSSDISEESASEDDNVSRRGGGGHSRRRKDSRRYEDDYYENRSYRRSYNHHHGEGGRRRRHGGERDRRERGYDSRTDLEESMNTSRRGHRGPSYPRGPRDHEESSMYDSRPSSRAGPDCGGPRGGPYVDPYGYPRGGPVYPHMLHPHHMPPQPPVVSQSTQPPSLDQDKLNIFRRNWEYYSSNPKAMDELRVKNPQKHGNLMRYYQMYSHLLPSAAPPASTIAGVTESERCPSVQSSATQSSMAGGGGVDPISANLTTGANISQIQTDTTDNTARPASDATSAAMQNNFGGLEGHSMMSTINPDPNGLDHYQPTLVDSALSSPYFVPGHGTDKVDEGNSLYDKPAYDPNQRLTPVKFGAPHVRGLFSARGVLVKVDAKSPKDGHTATVELHSLRRLLEGQPSFAELRDFPGPLVPGRTHKGEVIQFCQSKIAGLATAGRSGASATTVGGGNSTLGGSAAWMTGDKDSYVLLWELLILLLRQKNTIDGSDIAELLLKDRKDVHRPYRAQQRDPPNETTVEDEAVGEESASSTRVSQDRSVIVPTSTSSMAEEHEKHTAKFRDYLLFGHKREGLEYAMKHGLWGHALFLASKMDERSYSTVMLRFANGLVVNDPLQTLYQSMSGRQPIAVNECADANWGDWRPHLAMILSNPSSKEGLDQRSIMTLGDTLTERGYFYAGQFCYLMTNMELGSYTNRNAKLVLILGDRGLNSLDEFATNEAIQATEIFEYAQKLSNPDHMMVNLQYFKYVYAIRLIDHGMSNEALHYLEEIAGGVVKRPNEFTGDVGMDGPTMVNQVMNLAQQLKFLDPMYTTREGEASEMGDPQWITDFTNVVYQINSGSYSYQADQASNYQHEHNDYDATEAYGANNEQSNEVAEANTHLYQQQYETDHTTGGDQVVAPPASGPDQYNGSTVDAAGDEVSPVEATDGVAAAPHPPPPGVPMFMPSSSGGGVHDQQPMTPPMPPPAAETSSVPPTPSTPDASLIPSQPSIPMMVPTPMGQAPSLDRQTSLGGGHPSAPPSTPAHPPPDQPSYFNSMVGKSSSSQQLKPPTQPVNENSSQPQPGKEPAKKAEPEKSKKGGGSGLFGGFFGKFLPKPGNQVHLPDDNEQTIVWDPEKKKWVDKNADPNDEPEFKPPPTMAAGGGSAAGGLGGGPMAPPGGGNMFKAGLGKRRGLGRVDAFKSSQAQAPSGGPLPQPPSPGGAPPPLLQPGPGGGSGGGAMPPSMMMVPAPVDLAATPSGGGHNTDEHLQQTHQVQSVEDLGADNGVTAAPPPPPVFFNPNQYQPMSQPST